MSSKGCYSNGQRLVYQITSDRQHLNAPSGLAPPNKAFGYPDADDVSTQAAYVIPARWRGVS